MTTMVRNQFAKQLQDGLNTVFGMAYDDFEQQWDKIFTVSNSQKAFEEDVLMVGLGGAAVKAEGAAVQYDTGMEGWVARYQHTTIALAFAITQEAQEDNRYGDLGAKYAKALARSMRYTKEVRGASVLNNGFSAGVYAGGDGVALFSTSHPLMGGGTFANKPTTDADLSEESLEDASIAIEAFVDDRGIPVQVKPKRLICHRSNKPNAHRLLMTDLQAYTANNATNYAKDMKITGEGYAVNQYLTDSDAWFLVTDCPDGLKHFKRTGLTRGMEGDFETGNLRYKSRERYSFGFTDPRGAYGTQGA